MNYSIENLKSSLELIKSLEPSDITEQFLEFRHSCEPGSYCAAVLNPKSGKVHFINESSQSCSTDEYFEDSGVLSEKTLISSIRDYFQPGPDDWFELVPGKDYVHPEGQFSKWITSQEYENLDEEEKEKFTVWFSVGDTPIEGWLSNSYLEVQRVYLSLQEVIDSIELELEKLKEK